MNVCWIHASLVALFAAAPAVAQEPPTDAHDAAGQIAFHRGRQILLLDVAERNESVLVADNTYARPLYWLPTGDRLVYWNHDGGAWDLWAIDPDTKQANNLTRTARDNRSPCASPDGDTIAFHRGGDGVWLMDADGDDQRKVHELGHRDVPPVWAPSGRRLAFTHMQSEDDRYFAVAYLVELEHGRARASRSLGRGEAAGFVDEGHLVLEAAHEGQRELVVVDVETGERRPLTESAAADTRAVVSPSRSHVVWIERGAEDEPDRLKVMRADGSHVAELTQLDNWFAWPSWSPDGRFVAFESGPRRDATDVYCVPAAGGDAVRLTTKGGSFPVWRPARRR